MAGKVAQVWRFTFLQDHRAVGNPDAFPIEIHITGRGVAGGFLRTGAGKKRPVEHGQFRMPEWIRNRDGEQAGVFVIHVADLDALIPTKSRKPHTLPMEEVRRQGQGDPRALGRKRRISHHVALERFHERDSRILAATAAVGPPLIIGFRLQCDAETLYAHWITGIAEPHSCNADARVIALRNEPRKQVELTIRAANGSRIQDAFDLLGITRLRLHQ